MIPFCRLYASFDDTDKAIGGILGVYGHSRSRQLRQQQTGRGRKHGLPLVSTADGMLQQYGGSGVSITWEEACVQFYGSCASDIAAAKDQYVVLGNTTESLASLCGLGNDITPPSTDNAEGESFPSRIVGGKRASGDVYPYATVLFDSEGPFCTGVVIDPSFALTAAHCIDDSTVGVKIGVENWMLDDIAGRTYETRKIKKQWYHPDYDKMYSGKWDNLQPIGDVGIIQFDKPLENFTPPKLASSDKNTPKKLTVIGYGKTDEFAFDMSKNLREVNVDLFSRKKCEAALNKEVKETYGNSDLKYKITDAVICAGDAKGKKDACQGDSGGPLLVKGKTLAEDTVYGITSFGEGCARKGVPGGYTNVAKYYDWIQSIIKKQKAKML